MSKGKSVVHVVCLCIKKWVAEHHRWKSTKRFGENAKNIFQIVMIITRMCHKCKLHSLANVRAVLFGCGCNKTVKNWCGLVWPCLISVLNIRYSRHNSNATNKKIYAKHKANTPILRIQSEYVNVDVDACMYCMYLCWFHSMKVVMLLRSIEWKGPPNCM